MKKHILVLAVTLGLMLGIVGVIAAPITGMQNTVLIVNEDIHMVIAPSLLNFSALTPSTIPQAGPQITFDPTNSNVNVTVTAQVTMNTLFKGIDISEDNRITWTPIEDISLVLLFGSVAKTVDTRITIPLGTPRGIQSGQITYTVTGPTP